MDNLIHIRKQPDKRGCGWTVDIGSPPCSMTPPLQWTKTSSRRAFFAHLRLELNGFTHDRQMPLVKDRQLIEKHIRFPHVVGGNQDGHALAFGRAQR